MTKYLPFPSRRQNPARAVSRHIASSFGPDREIWAVQRLCNAFLSALKVNGCGPALALANSGDDQTETTNLLGLANGLAIGDDGWALIPYGESTHDGQDGRGDDATKGNALVNDARRGVVQRLNREDADLLVANFRSLGGRVKRALFGLNVFKGHPDAPRYAKLFPDKTPHGTIADMEARPEGLALKFVLNEDGTRLVESGWDEFSPYWSTMRVGTNDKGQPIVAPKKLTSVGLIPRGNIPGLSLINSKSEVMKEYLIQILAALGITVPADADESAIKPLVDTACGGLATANANLNAVKGEKATLESKVTTLEADKATLTGERDTLNTANAELKTRAEKAEGDFKAERKARATVLVDAAVTANRIKGADRDHWITELANAADFDAKAEELSKLRQGLPGKQKSTGLDPDARTAHAERQEKVLNLVNAAMDSAEIKAMPAEERYDAAFLKVKKDNPALFAEQS